MAVLVVGGDRGGDPARAGAARGAAGARVSDRDRLRLWRRDRSRLGRRARLAQAATGRKAVPAPRRWQRHARTTRAPPADLRGHARRATLARTADAGAAR